MEKYKMLLDAIFNDFESYKIIPFTNEIEDSAHNLIKIYQLKTLDAFQLASCTIQKELIREFVSCDKKLIKAALEEGIKIFNPLNK